MCALQFIGGMVVVPACRGIRGEYMEELTTDYRAAFLNNAVPMCIINDKGNLCSVNQAAADYFGNTPPCPDEISRLFSNRFGTGDGPVLLAAGEVPVSWRGEGARLLAAMDVTREARESARLRSAMEHIQVAEEGAGIGFWDTYIEEKRLSVDSGWARIIGYTVEELGQTIEEIFLSRIHPDDRAGVESFITRLDDGTTPSDRSEFRMRHRDGRWVWVRSVCRVVAHDDAGAPVRVAGMHMEITQEHEMLEALAEAKKKITLLSSVTRHDILNQVSIILMCDELVRGNTSVSMTPEQATRYWDMMNTAARTIEQVISFTRDYDTLGMEPPRWQSLGALVRNAEILMHGTGLPVTLSCGDLEVFADPLFEKVLYNLLENAVRHSREGSRVEIAFAGVDEEGAVITVSDDGAGVPADKKELIFDRGYGSNTGLGLFLCREMLAITGISITECGTPGEGAVFRLVFPAHHVRGYADPA